MKALYSLVALLIAVSLSGCASDSGNTSDVAQGAGAANLNGNFAGTYTYESGYVASMIGKSVNFHMKIAQPAGASTFTAVVNEPYTNFGVARNGRLWADVTGEVNGNHVHFVKTYRYFSQPSVIYDGSYNPNARQVIGSWGISGQTGSFAMRATGP